MYWVHLILIHFIHTGIKKFLISHLTIESIGSPYKDLSKTIKSSGYVYGAGVIGILLNWNATGKSAIAITAGASLNGIYSEGDQEGKIYFL